MEPKLRKKTILIAVLLFTAVLSILLSGPLSSPAAHEGTIQYLDDKKTTILELAAASNPRLHRAYLLKEGLRLALRLPADQIRDAVEAWRGRAWRSRIPEFVKLQRKVKRHLDAIVATARHGLTNARVEAVNNKIKLIVKMAYGFRNVDNLFAMVMLKCSDLVVELPGRSV